MSKVLAVLIAVVICVFSAGLEGVLAGGNVKQYLAKLRQPGFAMPLKGWFAIGGLYYVVCGIVLYRILRHQDVTALRTLAFILLVLMMIANAIWNYIFFRARNLFVSFVAFAPYIVVTLSLVFVLSRFDQISAGLISLYLLYLVYAIFWAYGVWRLNRDGP